MRNITVSVDDQVYRLARIRAAELDTTVSAAVREFLTRFSGEETDHERRKRLERETIQSITAFSASNRIGRDALHERHALP